MKTYIWERTMERMRIIAKSDRLTSALIGLIAGLLINLLTDSSVKTVSDFEATLRSSRPSNYVLWGSVAFLFLIPWARRGLDWYRAKRGENARLAKLLAARVDPLIKPYANGIVAIGSALTLQLTTDLREGWGLRDVKVDYDGVYYRLPTNLQKEYDQYFKKSYVEQRFSEGRTNYFIERNPKAFTDCPELTLKIRRAKHSEVQFYLNCIAPVEDRREALIKEAIQDCKITFPHALCLHGVVVTADEKVLVAKRSEKVGYYPNHWSVSLEEQFSDEDLSPDNDGAVVRWAKRFLLEELSITEAHYNVQNFRALAVFLEASILNCALAAVLKLDITAEEFDQIIRSRPRRDTEFKAWMFLTADELAKEFVEPGIIPLHPTSQYRMLLYLNHVWGTPHFAHRLFHSQS